ncbi:hypothetical protein CGC20_21000 [Leishmania donovani]|uniref:Uncharacterized protein n=1 Tax=Leishmania donovani TaxID=5661 RepID=A0A504XL17_LEIDO|nr:hypothetical protein CGC20_21000 [Leishmania donovani]
MTASAHQVTRLFLVLCGSSSPESCTAAAAKDVTFLELPCIPVATANSTESGGCASAPPRPLVSPAVHLGRQTPFLSSSLQNDRAWSRALLEVTTWCIEGLPSTSYDGVVPVDAATLPFAGVRVRLCGKGRPIRVVPSGAAGERESTTLTERGSYTWLQHGDVLEFGTQAQVRLLAVHVRVGHAAELVQHASFVWITSSSKSTSATGVAVSNVDAQPTMTAVPTALWFAGPYEWSAVPKFLKSKMLQEAEQLTLYMHDRDAYRLKKAAADTASISESNRLRYGGFDRKGTKGTAIRVSPWVESERRTHAEEVLVTSSPHCSEFGYSSPSNILAEWGQTRNAPAETASSPSLSAARERGSVVAAVSHPRFPSQPQQKDGCGSDAAPRPTAPPPLRASLQHRRNCGSTVYSLSTLSETMDDKLNEALLNLEDGGNEVGEALVERREKEAFLIVTEEDLSGTRISSAEELMASASQRTGLDDGAEDHGNVLGNTPAEDEKRQPVAGGYRAPAIAGHSVKVAMAAACRAAVGLSRPAVLSSCNPCATTPKMLLLRST